MHMESRRHNPAETGQLSQRLQALGSMAWARPSGRIVEGKETG
jgi:hypothetical protein